jgi:hypothetical protein
VGGREHFKWESASRILLALLAWLGVLLQLRLSIETGRGNGKSIISTLDMYFGYFTILTNIFVALSATAFGFSTPSRRSLLRRSLLGCATTSILLVGITYHFLLRSLWSPQGLQWVADTDLHYVVPLAALIHWALSRSSALSAYAPLAWCAYPAAYLAYALMRGAWLGVYPYPFIDAAAIGYPRVAAHSAALLALYIALGYAVWGLSEIKRTRA